MHSNIDFEQTTDYWQDKLKVISQEILKDSAL